MTELDQNSWLRIVESDSQRSREILKDWMGIADRTETIRNAIRNASQRGAALRLLLVFDDEVRQNIFAELIEYCSWGHADIEICRRVIKTMPRDWVIANIEDAVNRLLDERSGDDEAFRRFAELYAELDERLVRSISLRASESSNESIREVGTDYCR